MTNDSNINSGVSLQVRGLCKSFGGMEVLKNIDLDVQPGEIFVIMGPERQWQKRLAQAPDRP